jgi:N-methylhydantoinase B/oxoprolinase/acetone carboxylase alpha subunit
VGTTELKAGDRVQISTPGGGGWGSLDADAAYDDQADIS